LPKQRRAGLWKSLKRTESTVAAKDDKKPEKDDGKEEKEEKDAAEGEEGGDEDSSGESGKKKLSKKMLIIIAATGIVILVGGGAGLYFSGILGGGKKEAASEHKEEAKTAGTFFALGDILVNLSGEGKRPNYLKIKITLELADPKDVPTMESLKPRIIDNFQVYLRELRIEDLRGSAGLYRLREELLLRVTEAAQPVRIRDVLFQEMLVQ
jgi:flagellar protein FliL